MSTPTDILTTLRDAAERGNWNGCRDATEAALSRLPVSKILKLAHREVECRLPLFERHHPDIHWPRTWLSALATESPCTLDEETDEVLQEAPGPGGNSFAEAVRQLALAAAAADRKQCVTHALDAISGAIMAEKAETGGSEHRDLWDLWYQEGTSDGERLHPGALVTIMNDPKAVAVGLAAWNRLADELSAALDEDALV